MDNLERLRLAATPDIDRGRYFSIRFGESDYRVWTGQDQWDTGIQTLLPDRQGRWPRTRNQSGPPSVFDGQFGKKIENGYYMALPFVAKRTKGLLLDAAVNHFDPVGRIGVYASADLQTVEVRRGEESFQLTRGDSYSLSLLTFEEPTGTFRVSYIYDADDLAKLVKIYVWSADNLMEFWSCDAQPGCQR